MPKQLPHPEPEIPPARPVMADAAPLFLKLEREVELDYRPLMLAALQSKVDAVAAAESHKVPTCQRCGQPMKRHDARSAWWQARFGCLRVSVPRYRCRSCSTECKPLLELLGVDRPHLRLAGAFAGAAGHGYSLYSDGTFGLGAVGCHRESHEHLAGSAAVGPGSGAIL